MSILDIIKKESKKLLDEEGITENVLEMVDLNVEFSPVIPIRGDRPHEVRKTIGEKYLINHPMFPDAVSSETLKVMRCRYLINK